MCVCVCRGSGYYRDPPQFIHLGRFYMDIWGVPTTSPCFLGNAVGEGLKWWRGGDGLFVERMMMKANGIRLLQSHVVPRPLSTMTLQRSSHQPLSHPCSPGCNPMGELVWALTWGDADAQPYEAPNSSKATLGTVPSWDLWCHRGISALGRLTECLCQLYSGVRRGFGLQKAHFHSSLEPVKINTSFSSYRFILLKVRKMLKGTSPFLEHTADTL